MHSLIKLALAAVGGAIAGGTIVHMYMRDKCEREIDSVKAMYEDIRRSNEDTAADYGADDSADNHSDIRQSSIVPGGAEAPKIAYDRYQPKVPEGATYVTGRPDGAEPLEEIDTEVISPAQFGCEPGYRTEELTLYADGVLADSADFKVPIETTVGAYALTTFGSYDDNTVHVRNEVRRIDYEVVRVDASWGGQPNLFPPDE